MSIDLTILQIAFFKTKQKNLIKDKNNDSYKEN